MGNFKTSIISLNEVGELQQDLRNAAYNPESPPVSIDIDGVTYSIGDVCISAAEVNFHYKYYDPIDTSTFVIGRIIKIHSTVDYLTDTSFVSNSFPLKLQGSVLTMGGLPALKAELIHSKIGKLCQRVHKSNVAKKMLVKIPDHIPNNEVFDYYTSMLALRSIKIPNFNLKRKRGFRLTGYKSNIDRYNIEWDK